MVRLGVDGAAQKAAQEVVEQTAVRVSKPGGLSGEDIKALATNADVPARYSSHSEFNKLASDPDQSGKITGKTRSEAMAGLEAVEQGRVPGPIKRGPIGH